MSKNRLEAFSDGFIAIIITIMVFDLKIPENTSSQEPWIALKLLLPKFVAYMFSFLVLAVMWVNHHQLLHQIRHINGGFLWLNIHLLFWMSLIPFSTNFMGLNPFLPEADMVYGLIFFMNSLSFTILRNYAEAKKMLYGIYTDEFKRRMFIKNLIGVSCYFIAAFGSYISVYISFALFLLVPAMYFMPEKLEEEK
ncbi:MAG: TMEM175 family protein [Microscillaceae bacterium]|jgi:uncharacterized membrane protein|nr:TMEM175 family protein [Microscillaceae bacterium]